MTTSQTVIAELERMFELFPDMPKEAIIKQDILRQGIAFTEAALQVASGYKPKDYFIFSFDLVPLKEMQEFEAYRSPEEIRMTGGVYGLQPTIVSVRVNPESPYRVELRDGLLSLICEETILAQLEFPPIPEYYAHPLSSGKKISQIAPAIEWGYLVYLTVYRLCQYWGKDEECRFCDLNENYRQQKEQGREYTAVKSIEDIVEAMTLIDKYDTVTKAYTVTGGSITSSLQGMKEAEWYARYAEAIESRFAGRWIPKAVVQAFPKEETKLLREAYAQRERRIDCAPGPLLHDSTIESAGAVSRLCLRAGFWPVHPLCTPELVQFCRRLPFAWRDRRRIHRAVLASFGLPARLTHPRRATLEHFSDVMDFAIHSAARAGIEQLFAESRLAEQGLVDRAGLVEAFRAHGAARKNSEWLLGLVVLELTLRSVEHHRGAGSAAP